MNLIVTIGTFDGLHVGHIRLLKKCRALAGDDGSVIVGVNADYIVERRGKTLTQTTQQRTEALEALIMVDGTFRYLDSREMFFTSALADRTYDQCILVVGTDWAGRYHKLMGFDEEWLKSHRITVVYVDYTEGVSSTKIREKRRARR